MDGDQAFEVRRRETVAELYAGEACCRSKPCCCVLPRCTGWVMISWSSTWSITFAHILAQARQTLGDRRRIGFTDSCCWSGAGNRIGLVTDLQLPTVQVGTVWQRRAAFVLSAPKRLTAKHSSSNQGGMIRLDITMMADQSLWYPPGARQIFRSARQNFQTLQLPTGCEETNTWESAISDSPHVQCQSTPTSSPCLF